MKISQLRGREILDSRGNPTVEADVVLSDGSWGRAAVPSGASTGSHEAVELRDGEASRFSGQGVQQAIAHINKDIAQAVIGHDVADQTALDTILIELDGTPNKGRLGANAILAVSLACAQAAARALQLPLYRYLQQVFAVTTPPLLPLPLMNVINGGKHASGSTDIQEFMIVPVGAPTFTESVRYGAEIFHALKDVLAAKGYATTVGDEGGYAPAVSAGNAEALDLIVEAIGQAGFRVGEDVALAIDVAASEFYRDGKYQVATEHQSLTSAQMLAWLTDLVTSYPIVSLEDGLAESDWATWVTLHQRHGRTLQLVGDDLLVTNTRFLERAITERAANAILVKPNQIGTLSETVAAVKMARAAGWHAIISHRSGETEDTFIAHLAVALACGQIKTGSLSRSERTAKYNELLRIEEHLGAHATFAGRAALSYI